MRIGNWMTNWLETHWVTPAYSGWVLGGLSVFFFMAATNTLSGWLYVISGVTAALLAIAAVLSRRNLRGIEIIRRSIYPVSVGDHLTVELLLNNTTTKPKSLLQVYDLIPYLLGEPVSKVIESLNSETPQYWVYQLLAQRRGVYRWHTLQVRSAAPFGLFWGSRSHTAAATATVYPTVLPLVQCPLVDIMGRESMRVNSDQRSQMATEGLTRSLRPYRWGDSTRLIHWRTSARYGELRVRELELFTSGQELVVCLDSAIAWDADAFEQAVIAAASLYFYAAHQNLTVYLWTAATGLLQGEQSILEALAETRFGEDANADSLPAQPLIWLTQNSLSLGTLPEASRWVLWQPKGAEKIEVSAAGIVIQNDRPLQSQLQDAPSL